MSKCHYSERQDGSWMVTSSLVWNILPMLLLTDLMSGQPTSRTPTFRHHHLARIILSVVESLVWRMWAKLLLLGVPSTVELPLAETTGTTFGSSWTNNLVSSHARPIQTFGCDLL